MQSPSGVVDGDEIERRKRLIETHVEVARNIARGLGRRYGWLLDPDDIDSCAMVGLCEAAARFDRTRMEPFVAFAEQRIRGAILDEIRRLGIHGRVISKRQQRITAARSAISRGGKKPTDDRVATLLGLSLAAVQEAIPPTFRGVWEDPTALPSPTASPEAYISCAQFLLHLQRACEGLPEPDATIMRLHYDVGMSFARVARTLDLTLGRIRHVHARGLTRIQDEMCKAVAGGDTTSLRGSIPYPSLCELEVDRSAHVASGAWWRRIFW